MKSFWMQPLKWGTSEASKWILHPEQPLGSCGSYAVVLGFLPLELWSEDMLLLALTWFKEANRCV